MTLDRTTSPSRRGRSVRAILASLVACLVALAPAATPVAIAADLFGHDVSWPQCTSAQGGYNLPMPPDSSEFVIIGLTKGAAFTENPCLDTQVSWATSRNKPAHGYTMATYPSAAQLSTYGAAGPFNTGTTVGKLANVGYAEGQFALKSLADIGWRPPVVWIDVEPRPATPWPGATAEETTNNRFVVQGLVRALRDAGLGYGFYSYTNGWKEIVGTWAVPGVPVWATAGTLDYPDEALDRCTQPSFSTGKVYLSQWTDGTRDYNRTCGSYAFTDLPRNLVGTAAVTASSNDAVTSPSPARAVDGVVQGYPVDSSMEWSSNEEKAGAWLELRWPSPVTIDRVVLHDRPNADDQVTGGTLTFSDGSTVSVGALPNDGAAADVTFSSRTVTSLRFQVNATSAATWAVGLAEIEVWGTAGGTVTPPADDNLARSGAQATASSQDTAAGQGAAKAIDGVVDGYPNDSTKEWATIGGKAGSWIQLTWANPVTLNRVVLHDRPNTNDQVTGGILTFSDGSTVAVPALTNTGAATTVTFSARATTSVRLTVTSTSGATENIGLAELQAWGTPGGTFEPVSRLFGADAFETAAAISQNAFPSGAATVFVATGSAFPDALAAAPVAALENAPVLLVTLDEVPVPTADELTRLAPETIVLLGGPLAVSEAVEQTLAGYTTSGTAQSVTRIWGQSLYDTAAAISEATFSAGAPVVYVATGENFPDALGGGAVAARDGAPVVLVGQSVIPEASVAELDRLTPERIIVLGGPLAVDESVVTQLQEFTTAQTPASVTRVWGQSAYDTAVEISKMAYPSGAPLVYLATGGTFPDALAASPVAGSRSAPILLLPPTGTVPANVAEEIRRLAPQHVVVLGGELAITASQYDAVASLLTTP